jgi:hypothetical protein
VPVRAGGDIRGKMSIVFVAPGAVGVVGGLAAVGIAKRFPSNESALKLWGARIAILGLALAGLFLPFIGSRHSMAARRSRAAATARSAAGEIHGTGRPGLRGTPLPIGNVGAKRNRCCVAVANALKE